MSSAFRFRPVRFYVHAMNVKDMFINYEYRRQKHIGGEKSTFDISRQFEFKPSLTQFVDCFLSFIFFKKKKNWKQLYCIKSRLQSRSTISCHCLLNIGAVLVIFMCKKRQFRHRPIFFYHTRFSASVVSKNKTKTTTNQPNKQKPVSIMTFKMSTISGPTTVCSVYCLRTEISWQRSFKCFAKVAQEASNALFSISDRLGIFYMCVARGPCLGIFYVCVARGPCLGIFYVCVARGSCLGIFYVCVARGPCPGIFYVFVTRGPWTVPWFSSPSEALTS